MGARSRNSKLSRREFLRGATAAGAALALSRWLPRAAQARRFASPAVPPHRVVHAHNDEATSWDYATGWYGDYVSQAVVDEMTDRGVMTLTNTGARADAWRALIPAYTAGQIVAIKINLVNAICADADNVIDALPQPINSVIRGLKAIGVNEHDIWVYDVAHTTGHSEMPARLVNKVTELYPDVQFHSYTSSCSTSLGYSGSEMIHFNVPPGKPPISDRPVCNALVNAAHLINMPIMKRHARVGVTLGFKNHFGSFEHCDYVHWSVILDDSYYTSAYSGLIDVYNNTHFKDKTRLTVGDGLFGSRINQYCEPEPWSSFGGKSPNSLFFSVDPVAMDCVMYDFLAAETVVPPGSDDYLKLAGASGLGAFEHWDAAHEYHVIDYRRALPPPAYLPLIHRGDST